MMKNSLALLIAVLTTQLLSAQYKPVDQGSDIKFTVNNFGFAVNGSFSGLQGSIDFDPQNAAAGRFEVSIDAGTVNTDNNLRDSHLKDDSYFDVKNYPRIRLVSTRLAPEGKAGAYRFTGQLTIKDKSKEVSFPFTAVPVNGGVAFKGSFTINRKDFGVGGTSTISNELKVSLNVIANK
jgi:polyisoprenoid-binding protein YceI